MSPIADNKKRKKKTNTACVFCRRSHMICDNNRPCARCVKRDIAHLCRDEPTKRQKSNEESSENGKQGLVSTLPESENGIMPLTDLQSNSKTSLISQLHPFTNKTNPFFYSEHANLEFSSLNEFLSMIDDPDVVSSVNNEYTKGFGSFASLNNEALLSKPPSTQALNEHVNSMVIPQAELPLNNTVNPLNNTINTSMLTSQAYEKLSESDEKKQFAEQQQQQQQQQQQHSETAETAAISESAKDKFFLTAADPSTEITPEERLKQVIKAKLDAGLLQPYNYAEGYARLQNYMDNYMNHQSRLRISKPLSVFRPAFRAIARTLKDVDLILVEEAFERMLLDYDRVFTSMAIPACLWRRTGEIYRGNKEFAQLVEVNSDALKDGKLTIYELMSEESAVNFWEKYGAIAFDKGQKAVLTSCNLRTKDGRKRKACCFNFTIRRDRYNIPSCIVGNFIPLDG